MASIGSQIANTAWLRFSSPSVKYPRGQIGDVADRGRCVLNCILTHRGELPSFSKRPIARAMLEVLTPTCRAISAIDNPNSSRPRFPIAARRTHTFLKTQRSLLFLHYFHGLRYQPVTRLSLAPLSGLTFRRCRIHLVLRAAVLLLFLRGLHRFSTSGCPDALDACYVAPWRLPRPDLHRLADDDFSGHTIDWLAIISNLGVLLRL